MRPSLQTLDWLGRLVRFDTTSRRSNLPLVDAVSEFASGLGVQVRRFPNADGTKANLVLTVPDAEGRRAGGVMLSGHTDCVPVEGQTWTSDPFTVVERDGRVYGRGTADMKGFIACCLAALPGFVERPLREPLHVALSYDEEVGCLGAGPLVASCHEAGLSPRLGFVGEPTSMQMIRGHKSINVIEVELTGVPAHSSLTHRGVNAIEYGAEIVSYWRGQADRWRDQGPYDEAYPLAYSSASVNLIAGGNGVNIIPEKCLVTLEFRAIAGVDNEQVIAALRENCAGVERRMRAENEAARVEVRVRASTVGLELPDDAEALRLGSSLGLRASEGKVTYGTEAGVFTGGGIPSIVCGPGDIAQAHRPDEWIELAELASCEAFLSALTDALRVR